MKLELQEFRELCEIIINIDCKPTVMINYAKSYAKEGLQLVYASDIKFQIPYIIGNLQYWRGEEAKLTKLRLRKLAKKLCTFTKNTK